MRLLAVLVGLLSLGQLLEAFLFSLPHSDAPLQPVASLLVIAAAGGGLVLARGLWRRRAGVARAFAAWGVGIALCVVGLVMVVASPTEQRDAWPALVAGLAAWAVLVALITHTLGRRTRSDRTP